MAFEKKITVETSKGEITFNINANDYNKYLNATQPNNKVQPATNFLLDTVIESHVAKLKELVQEPGAPLFLVGAVVEEYQPEFNFKVKKSKAEPSK
ncbi:putative phage tail assembly chaperone [Pseudoalteromonas sp. 68 DY56-GL68]|uniref:putative phage tail assembly chaperone n=1 Tax=Pseudoalteromonas sp. 68 DY56-GL68 TaxID=2974919 RepID=UPI00352A8C0A